jgi:two-component system chemotaxis response regulator CheY
MTAHILYIEDDVLSLRLVERSLRHMDYQFHEALCGLRGIRAAEDAHLDLILVDMNLGDMMGYQVIEYLRQQPKTAKTPIIALTAETSDEVYARCVQAGCNGYLLKPISHSHLLRTVNQFISHYHTTPLPSLYA